LALAAFAVSFMIAKHDRPIKGAPSNNTQSLPPPIGERSTNGFTLAFIDEQSATPNDLSCPPDLVCVRGRYEAKQRVRLLLPGGQSCLGMTDLSFRLKTENEEFDATTIVDLDSCSAMDIGHDTPVAVIGDLEFINAEFQWLPVQGESTPKDRSLLQSQAVRSTLNEFVQRDLSRSGGKSVEVEMTAGKKRFLHVRGGDRDGNAAKYGPLFSIATNKPVLLHKNTALCFAMKSSFVLNQTQFLRIEGASCGSLTKTTVILRWNEQLKQWTEVSEIPSIIFRPSPMPGFENVRTSYE